MDFVLMQTMPEIREVMEFNEAITATELISTLKTYIYFMFKGEKISEHSISLEITVSYSGKSYIIESYEEFVRFVDVLNGTKPFTLTVSHGLFKVPSLMSYGINIDSLGVFNDEKTFLDRIMEYTGILDFNYKCLLFDGYKVFADIIVGGEVKEIKMDTDIIEKEIRGWHNGDGIVLRADFDYESYPYLVDELRAVVKKRIPEEELEYCEEFWEDCDDPCVVVGGINWCPDELSEITDFISELNEVIEESRTEVFFSVEESSFMALNNFAVAQLCVIDNKVCLVGAEF